ncbi:MAG: hypothetical protein H7282_05370 [Cytophagaceae bacterium]|nr:hypothetical protein [Cytophagaceae bacterium]
MKRGEKAEESWTWASHKKVKLGDRAFVYFVGTEPREIFASSSISSEPFIDANRKGNERSV